MLTRFVDRLVLRTLLLALLLSSLTALPMGLRFGGRVQDWRRVLLHLRQGSLITCTECVMEMPHSGVETARAAAMNVSSPAPLSVARSALTLAHCRFLWTGTVLGR